MKVSQPHVLPFQTSKKKKKGDFIPYRDSVLTWLLRENLGKRKHLTNMPIFNMNNLKETDMLQLCFQVETLEP